jgi:hypothetical protein
MVATFQFIVLTGLLEGDLQRPRFIRQAIEGAEYVIKPILQRPASK